MTLLDWNTFACVIFDQAPFSSLSDIVALHRRPQHPAADGLQRGRAVFLRDPLLQVRARDPAGHDVIRQDLGQRALVLGLQQRVHRSRRQFRERRVGRREHGEGSGAHQRVHEPRRFHRCDQRRVIRRVHRVLHDVLVREHFLAADDGILRGVANRCRRSQDRQRRSAHSCELLISLSFLAGRR